MLFFTKKNEASIYLSKRSVQPMKGIWYFGGRVFFNDKTLEGSISRCIKKETGLIINPDRFKFLCLNLYSWIKTAQGNFPGKNLGISFSCEITDLEIEEMQKNLSSSEYDLSFGIQKFDRIRIINEKLHPAVLDAFNKIFS